MKMKRFDATILALLAAGAAALALAGCNNSFGVLRDIQTETAQTGTDLFKNASVKALGGDGTNYYAVMAKVFYRPVTGSTWAVLPVGPSALTGYYCSGFASDDAGAIYVAASDNAGTDTLTGIYTTSDSGATWTELGVTAFASKKVDALFYANGTLFATTHTDTEEQATYDLYYYDGSQFASAGLSGLAVPVRSVAYAHSTYWAMTNATMYTSASASGFSTGATNTPGTSKVLAAMTTDHSADLLVTTDDGILYTYAGSSWGSATVTSSVELGTLADLPVDSAASDYRLMIAKHNTSYGYYEYDPDAATVKSGNDSSAVFVPKASNYTTTVYQKPVLAIYYSAANNTILIGMTAQGTDTYALYHDTYSSGAWSGWTAE